ncbi:hypothetical protein F9817_12790 [Vibrio sp. CAIM 722]|uniref:Uncharacterized protein n=1 Tax=Vibrio eleionomae TaxID=2653505 RepID=A0A7X4LLE4_9VIBR|nr:hypothetical protein [Vibrio eleionomae]MZI94069.1 hypothetical protein [Vibrio eleionomae]
MINFFKGKSRAQRVQARLERGESPSEIAVTITGKVTPKKYNTLIKKAVTEYNLKHKGKLFGE